MQFCNNDNAIGAGARARHYSDTLIQVMEDMKKDPSSLSGLASLSQDGSGYVRKSVLYKTFNIHSMVLTFDLVLVFGVIHSYWIFHVYSC